MHIEVTLVENKSSGRKIFLPVKDLVVLESKNGSMFGASFYFVGDRTDLEPTKLVETYEQVQTLIKIEEHKKIATQIMAGFAANSDIDLNNCEQFATLTMQWVDALEDAVGEW